MSRFHSYMNTAEQLIKNYKGDVPLAIFMRSFFSANKKFGSKDRKQISALCYNYFRIGSAANGVPPQEKILMAFFLCENESSDLLEALMPEWNQQINQSLQIKFQLLGSKFILSDLFPFAGRLSETIDAEKFSISFLVQPDLFLRIRPKTRLGFLKKLEKSKLEYTIKDDDCVVLTNSTNVEEYFTIDKEVIIQDYNSQKVFDFFKPQNATYETPLTTIWDCCAASGGKSILLFDIFNQRIDLTVSDIRPSIILNLHQRFNKAGLKSYKYFIADIEKTGFEHPVEPSSIIVCDVPCTGSGTWARTPEQLAFFKEDSIKDFSDRQKKITTNVIPYLKPGGTFVYITCSVFKEENEEVVRFILSKFDLELLRMELLKGYDKKADSMFIAVFRKK
ncbi:Fmu (Sun) domain-containing protein [Ferruginibacter sp. SUN002]|uniref:Fmu (Sun) domain-containing protein n=1 Tax=Ferruginibacter sp. SUN002 TaxID=2937789 RepID=UPI003D36CECD